MSKHTPNKWTILKFVYNDETTYRVLGGWSGGYLDGDSWRLSSPIVEHHTEKDGDREFIRFINESGSEYICYRTGEGFNMIMSSTYAWLQEQESVTVESLSWGEYLEKVNHNGS